MNSFYFPQRVRVFLFLFFSFWTVGLFLSFLIPKESPIIFLNALRSPLFDTFFYSVNYWPEPVTIAAIGLVYLLFKPYRFLVLLMNLLIIMPVTFGLKTLVEKSRPIQELGPELAQTLSRNVGFFSADSMSFPSGHTTSAFALVVFCLYEPKIKNTWAAGLLFFLALSAALSRIYLGHHYLEDVLAGAFLGTFLSISITAYVEKNISLRIKEWRWKNILGS